MLLFSKKTEYALRALLAMAREPATTIHTIQNISAQENIPERFLEQILLSLRQGGLLSSKRGAGGGYMLRLPVDQIRVGQVVELIEGQQTHGSGRGADGHPVLASLFAELETEWKRLLDAKSIGDLRRLEQENIGGSFEI